MRSQSRPPRTREQEDSQQGQRQPHFRAIRYPEEETEDGELEAEDDEEIEEQLVGMEAMDRHLGEDHIMLQLCATSVVDRDTWLQFVPVEVQIVVDAVEDLATEEDVPAAGAEDV